MTSWNFQGKIILLVENLTKVLKLKIKGDRKPFRLELAMPLNGIDYLVDEGMAILRSQNTETPIVNKAGTVGSAYA